MKVTIEKIIQIINYILNLIKWKNNRKIHPKKPVSKNQKRIKLKYS